MSALRSPTRSPVRACSFPRPHVLVTSPALLRIQAVEEEGLLDLEAEYASGVMSVRVPRSDGQLKRRRVMVDDDDEEL